ncbi:hypothetical protein LINGRAHAP2_LOCUS7184 [Linum grandiflorum]
MLDRNLSSTGEMPSSRSRFISCNISATVNGDSGFSSLSPACKRLSFLRKALICSSFLALAAFNSLS